MVMFIGEAEVQKYLDWQSLIAAMETALIGFFRCARGTAGTPEPKTVQAHCQT
jgi:hypothetical protein